MKRKYYLLTIVSLLFVGCSHEDSVFENPVISFNEFTATLDRPVTRLSMDNQGKLAWDATDVIGIYSDLTAQPVEFTYKGNNTFASTTEVRGSEFKAIYPYRANAVDASNKAIVHYTLPKDYMIDSYTLPMVAQSNSNQFSFKQTMGLLHFVLNDAANTKTVSLKGNNNELLAGSGYIDLSANEPVFVLDNNGVTAASSSVTINMPISTSDTVTKKKLDIFFPVPIGSYTKGFNITIETSEGTTSKVSNDPVTVARATFDSYTEFSVFNEVRAANLAKEREALIAYYNALDGPNWTYQDNWCSDKPVDQWYGVYTDNDGFVEEIWIDENKLKGDVPAEIGNLKHLKYLYFYEADITSLPKEIYQMDSLQYIWLDYTQITSLPYEIGDIKSLKQFEIMGSSIETLPEGLCNSKTLETIYLSETKISNLPSDLSKITTLSSISLYNNNFTSIPDVLFSCTGLTSLYINEPKIGGELSASIGNLVNLEYLYIYGTQLSSNLPATLSNLKKLDGLRLYNNQFTGNIPESLANLPKLDFIDLTGNKMSGTLPSSLINSTMWKNLSSIKISPQQNGYGFDGLVAITNLSLPYNSITISPQDDIRYLDLIFTPENPTDKRYTVETANASICVIRVGTRKPYITGKKPGKTTVTVRAVDTEAFVTCEVIVKGIVFDTSALFIAEGGSEIPKFIQYGDEKIEWYSFDSSVATVDSNGKITAVNPGQTTIRASIDKVGTYEINVIVYSAAFTSSVEKLNGTNEEW